MKVWKITSIDMPSGYPYVSTDEEAKHYIKIFSETFYTGRPILGQWEPMLVCNLNSVDIGKIVLTNKEFWVLTLKAKKLLHDLIGGAVEYLPLLKKSDVDSKISLYQQQRESSTYGPIIESIHEQEQVLLNILNIKSSAVIDFETSDLMYDEADDYIYAVEKLSFKAEKIINDHLFKVDNPGNFFKTSLFVSDDFKRVVEENKLTGLLFSEEPIDEDGSLIWTAEA